MIDSIQELYQQNIIPGSYDNVMIMYWDNTGWRVTEGQTKPTQVKGKRCIYMYSDTDSIYEHLAPHAMHDSATRIHEGYSISSAET